MDRSNAPTIERRLGGALEPVIGQVFFAPEAHAAYAELGFAGSAHDANGVALPDGPAYFTSRGSLMGQVRGSVVASAFAVFNPAAVIPSVEFGWSITDAETICAARDHGALAQLERLLGPTPQGHERVAELLVRATDGLGVEGRPLAAGAAGRPDPDAPLGTIFRRGEVLREYRGDSHTAAWVAAGVDAVEIGLLTELYWGLAPRSYARTRAWSDDDFDRATDALRGRGLVSPDGQFTEAGRTMREQIEVDTDTMMAPVMARLGDDAEELVDLLVPWGVTIRAGKGYLASGPHDLAG
jgi:hypothetical protein